MSYTSKSVLLLLSASSIFLASLPTSARADGISGHLLPQGSSSPNQTVNQSVTVNVEHQEDDDKKQSQDKISTKEGAYPGDRSKHDVQPSEHWLTHTTTSAMMMAGCFCFLIVVRFRNINIKIEIK